MANKVEVVEITAGTVSACVLVFFCALVVFWMGILYQESIDKRIVMGSGKCSSSVYSDSICTYNDVLK